MDTLKLTKQAKFHFIIFTCGCIISNVGFYLNCVIPKDLFFGIGLYGMLLWAINPLPLIYSLKGLLHYRMDRKCEDYRTIIGSRWLLLPSILLGSTALYCVSAGIMIALTGGA
jgi:hypothetical protein